jgi:LytS/YehU family sensor histidine kinase
VIDKRLWERAWFQIAAVLALGGCLSLLFRYRLRAVRKKSAIASKIAELEQMALIARMNPHFIFNCLNSIQNHLLEKDIRAVNGFITNFSRLIRLTLDISVNPRISLQTEIDYISTYLELERRRFENKFEYGMLTDPGLDARECHIPPLILQPYIENAILHGIAGRPDDRGRIEVRISAHSERLVCVIEDNGVGRRKAAQNKASRGNNYQPLGMALTAKRIDSLNVSVTIEDLEDDAGNASGTRVTIHFPILDL